MVEGTREGPRVALGGGTTLLDPIFRRERPVPVEEGGWRGCCWCWEVEEEAVVVRERPAPAVGLTMALRESFEVRSEATEICRRVGEGSRSVNTSAMRQSRTHPRVGIGDISQRPPRSSSYRCNSYTNLASSRYSSSGGRDRNSRLASNETTGSRERCRRGFANETRVVACCCRGGDDRVLVTETDGRARCSARAGDL